jgi:hypothetical protein
LRAQNWSVAPFCAALWAANKASRRSDTFIGIIDTDTWTIYLAPCFGVTADEALAKLVPDDTLANAKEQASTTRHGPGWGVISRLKTPKSDTIINIHAVLNPVKARLDICNVPDDLKLVASSTSREKDTQHVFTWAVIKGVYGPRGACLVLFEDSKLGFDGKSHQAVKRWVEQHNVIAHPAAGWYSRALGFAIQRDKLGYYVRFSSTLNKKQGMAGGDTFAGRVVPGKQAGREARDLPKEWAEKLVTILARDLHMGCFAVQPPNPKDKFDSTGRNKYFGRMVSRGEGETTKYKRIHDPADFGGLFDRLT